MPTRSASGSVASKMSGLTRSQSLEAELECGTVLRIGIRAGREVSVRIALLVHDAQVIEADTLQYPRDAFEPRAVERRVDDAQLTRRPRIFGFDGLRRDLVEEAIDNGVINPLDQTGGKRLLEVHALDVIEKSQAVNALLDFDGGLRGQSGTHRHRTPCSRCRRPDYGSP